MVFPPPPPTPQNFILKILSLLYLLLLLFYYSSSQLKEREREKRKRGKRKECLVGFQPNTNLSIPIPFPLIFLNPILSALDILIVRTIRESFNLSLSLKYTLYLLLSTVRFFFGYCCLRRISLRFGLCKFCLVFNNLSYN